MLGFLLLAAEEAAEPSKVPFFIAGGLLAAWAMVLFVFGMRTEGFPENQSVARAVMTVSVVLVLAAMATAVITA
jgi:hypothetical protein